MNYVTTLKVSDKELFDALLYSVVNETAKITGKEYSMADVKAGIKYKKKTTKGKTFIDVTTHIKPPVPNKEIHLRVVYPDTVYDMIYKIDKVSDYVSTVSYSQTDEKNTPVTAIQKSLFYYSIHKKFKKAEKYIIQQRKQKAKQAK